METVLIILIVFILIVVFVSRNEKRTSAQGRHRRKQKGHSNEYFENDRTQNITQARVIEVNSVEEATRKPFQMSNVNDKSTESQQKGEWEAWEPEQAYNNSDLDCDYSNLENLNIPAKSLLKDNLKKEDGRLFAVLKSRDRSNSEAAKGVKKGDLIYLKKTGKATIAVLREDKKRIGTLDYKISKYLVNFDLLDIDCKVSRATLTKSGDMSITIELMVDAVELAKVEFPELARWDPLSSDHFWVSLNNAPMGKRRWKPKSGTYSPLYSKYQYDLTTLAERECRNMINRRRFKKLHDDKISGAGLKSVTGQLRGLEYRREAAQRAARELQEGDIVVIVPDNYNSHDPNALAVFTPSGLHIGYIDKMNAEIIRDNAWDIIEGEISCMLEHIYIEVFYVADKSI